MPKEMDYSAKDENGKTLSEFLEAYDPKQYPSPAATSDMCVMTLLPGPHGSFKPAILLIKRRNHPDLGAWALPGGFIEMDETFLQAAQRELMEETGIQNAYLMHVRTMDAIGRDLRTRIITEAFFAAIPHAKLKPRAGDDAADAALFTLDISRSFTKGAHMQKRRDVLTLKSGKHTLRGAVGCTSHTIPAGWRHTHKIYDYGNLGSDHILIIWHVVEFLRTLDRMDLVRALAGSPCTRREFGAAAESVAKLVDI